MIRNKFIFFTIFFFLFALISCSKPPSGKITISGELKNVPNNKVVLNLEEDINRKKSRVIAEISLDQNGRFRFDQNLVPSIYSLKISDNRSVTLAVDKGQNVVISGDASDPNSIIVSGSEDTAKLEAYEKFRQESLNRLVISIRNKIKELKVKKIAETDSQMMELSRLELENYDKHKDEMIEFVKREMGASIAIYPTSVRWDGEKNIPFLNELAKQFEAKHPDLSITEKVKEKVRILTNNSLGGKVAEISMADKNDQIIPLTSIKAKLILIDFWGSWCAPCRRESPELSELYQKYHSKGFDIYGVALESEKESWLKAIEHDKRVWTNVASFTEFETPTAFDYAVTSLPANFLIDENGKIVAKNLYGADLIKEVKTLLEK